MKPLYEIAVEYQRCLNDVLNMDDLSEDKLTELDQLDDDIKNKAINTAAVIKNLELESESIDKAILSMQERKGKVEKKIDYLKKYLKENMERCNLKEVKSPYFDIKLLTNPPSVLINDEKLVPPQYYREIITKKLDKNLISQELKNNTFIPGTLLEQRTRLEIR